MVELIHDDDVEMLRLQIPHATARQGLDRGEDVSKRPRLVATHPLLTERRVPQDHAEGLQRLVEDLLPMGNEEQTRRGYDVAQSRKVQGCHDRLARARRRDQQIAMVTGLPRHGQLLEHALLERMRADVEELHIGVGLGSICGVLSELHGIEGDEVAG